MPEGIVELVQAAALARRENRLVEAHRDLAEAVVLCRQAGARAMLIVVLKGLGQIERDLGHGEAARELYEEAVGICRGENDPLQLAHTVRHLGDIHRAAGHDALAMPYYTEALALYRGHRETPPLDLANTIRGLALLKERAGEAEEALLLWTEAGDLYALAQAQAGIDESAARIARLRA